MFDRVVPKFKNREQSNDSIPCLNVQILSDPFESRIVLYRITALINDHLGKLDMQ